jgi:hypothetical protein
VRNVALYFCIPALTGDWLNDAVAIARSDVQGKFNVRGEIKNRKRADVCGKFGLGNSTIQIICKNRTKINDELERNGSGIKRYRMFE